MLLKYEYRTDLYYSINDSFYYNHPHPFCGTDNYYQLGYPGNMRSTRDNWMVFNLQKFPLKKPCYRRDNEGLTNINLNYEKTY